MTTQPEYILVPREPTQEQVDAGRNHDDLCDRDNCRRIYRAMTANGVPVAQVHAPAPDSAGNGGEQTRPSSPGAGAPREEINVVELLYSVRKQVHAHQKQLGEDWQDWADEIVGDLSSAIAALQQPSAQEAVGEAVNAPGTNGGFTMAVFHSEDVPVRTKLYTAPTLRPVSGEDVAAAMQANVGGAIVADWLPVKGDGVLAVEASEVIRAAIESFIARREAK